jgi:hypothetical protein
MFLTIASCVAAPPALATLTISKKATKAVTCSAGVCTATAKVAVLNVTDLTNMLATSGVTIESGKKAQTIDIAAPLAWGSGSGLILNAYTSITLEQPLVVQGTAPLYIGLNDGGSGGTLSFSGKGSITFWDLANHFEIMGQTYTLVRDIAGLAAAIKADPAGAYALASSYNAKPDGIYKTPPVTTVLSGTFEGLGNTISNLKITVTKPHSYTGSGWKGQVGLFAGISGMVENLNVTNAKVSAPDDTNAGILVGELSGVVANSHTTGALTSGNAIPGAAQQDPDAGGLVGAMFFDTAYVINSDSTAPVTAGDSAIVGGLVGSMFIGGHVWNSHATGAVTAGNNILGGYQGASAGGLVGVIYNDPDGTADLTGDWASGSASVGENDSNYAGGLVGAVVGGASIQLSHASGAATVGQGNTSTSQFGYAGGLLGELVANSGGITGSVQQSFATGAVAGDTETQIGGLIGTIWGSAVVSDTYSTGSVTALGTGLTALGGFAGVIGPGATVSTSYSTGAVAAMAGDPTGGFVGYLQDGTTLASDYWDTDLSGITNLAQGAGNVSNAPGITGLSTAQLQSGLPAGFSPSVWTETGGVNIGLPYLIALPPGGAARMTGHALPLARAAGSPFSGLHLRIQVPHLVLKK